MRPEISLTVEFIALGTRLFSALARFPTTVSYPSVGKKICGYLLKRHPVLLP